MASVVIYKYLGDKFNAKSLRHFGFAQLEILRNAMRFQGLKQNKRIVEFASGINVTCTSVFGIDTVNIYVPPLLKAVKDVIVVEEYCWCSTYFTEGDIVGIINNGKFEGTYVSNNYYQYYTDRAGRFIKIPDQEDAYNGIHYLVIVCRGRSKRLILCAAADLGSYQIGTKVILFYAGNWSSGSQWRDYTFNPFLERKACQGLTGACAACNASLKPKVPFAPVNVIDGAYVIVPLGFKENFTETEVIIDDVTYSQDTTGNKFLQVTQAELETGEVYLGVLYKEEGKTLSDMVDFKLNKVKVKLSNTNGDEVEASVCFNCQETQKFEDRSRVALYALKNFNYLDWRGYYFSDRNLSYTVSDEYRLLILKRKDSTYVIIGIYTSTPFQQLTECLTLFFTTKTLYSYDYPIVDGGPKGIIDLDNDIKANLLPENVISTTPYIEKGGGYKIGEVLLSSITSGDFPVCFPCITQPSGGVYYIEVPSCSREGFLIPGTNQVDYILDTYSCKIYYDLATYMDPIVGQVYAELPEAITREFNVQFKHTYDWGTGTWISTVEKGEISPNILSTKYFYPRSGECIESNLVLDNTKAIAIAYTEIFELSPNSLNLGDANVHVSPNAKFTDYLDINKEIMFTTGGGFSIKKQDSIVCYSIGDKLTYVIDYYLCSDWQLFFNLIKVEIDNDGNVIPSLIPISAECLDELKKVIIDFYFPTGALRSDSNDFQLKSIVSYIVLNH